MLIHSKRFYKIWQTESQGVFYIEKALRTVSEYHTFLSDILAEIQYITKSIEDEMQLSVHIIKLPLEF